MMFVNPSRAVAPNPLGRSPEPPDRSWACSRLVGSGKYSYASEGNWIAKRLSRASLNFSSE